MAQFVLVVDTSMMAVAVPAIVRDLGTTVGAVQAAIALYPLVTGALMLTGGKIGSILGAKRAFIYASIVFGIGAVIAVFAPGIGSLTLGWAVIEGLGAAVLVPLNYALII
jgi:MFS family permease